MKATKLCYKGSLSPSKAPEFRNYHAVFTDLFRVQKYREMAGEVDAKSFEPGIQVQLPERNVCSLTHIINPLLTKLAVFLGAYRPLPRKQTFGQYPAV